MSRAANFSVRILLSLSERSLGTILRSSTKASFGDKLALPRWAWASLAACGATQLRLHLPCGQRDPAGVCPQRLRGFLGAASRAIRGKVFLLHPLGFLGFWGAPKPC